MKPAISRIGSGKPADPYHKDFSFDGLTLAWTPKGGQPQSITFQDLVPTARGMPEWATDRDWAIKTFVDCRGIPEDGVENLVYSRYEYLGILFSFETEKARHQIRFFHNGEGVVVF